MPNLTTAQVAARTGVSVRTVHRMIASGDLKYAQKFPGHTGGYLFRLSDIRRAFPDKEIVEPVETEDVPA